MSKPFVFEKPIGMRDTLPDQYQLKEALSQQIKQLFRAWGYECLQTPTLEYYDTIGGVSSTLEQRLFKLLDHAGRTLVLRPDLTAPIARIVGSLLKDQPLPLRLAYEGNVFRAQQTEAGRNAEFTELGVELIGESVPDADGEVIALAIEALSSAQVAQYHFAIGHASLIRSLLLALVKEEEAVISLMRALQEKNVVGYRADAERFAEDQQIHQLLLEILELKGQESLFPKLEQFNAYVDINRYITDLKEIWSVLKHYQKTAVVHFDLTLMKSMDYYTGIHFEGVAAGLGYPICTGGRYDQLLEQFDRSAPAVGFSIKLDRVLQVSQYRVDEKQDLTLIIYAPDLRKEAITQAKQLRTQGIRVMLKQAEPTTSGQTEKFQAKSTQLKDLDEWIHHWRQVSPRLNIIRLLEKEGHADE